MWETRNGPGIPENDPSKTNWLVDFTAHSVTPNVLLRAMRSVAAISKEEQQLIKGKLRGRTIHSINFGDIIWDDLQEGLSGENGLKRIQLKICMEEAADTCRKTNWKRAFSDQFEIVSANLEEEY